MVTNFAEPVPAGCVHIIRVAVVQLSVVHGISPIDMDGVESVEPKFMPDNVCVEPPVVGPFAAIKDVTTGEPIAAQEEHRLLSDPIRPYPSA